MKTGLEGQNTNCGFCQGSDSCFCYSTESLDGQAYHIRECHECGAFFLSPRPTSDQLKQVYDESYYGQEESKFPPFIERLLDLFRHSRSKRVQRYIPSRSKILDVGCGNGQFLWYLIDTGYEGFGIELPGKAAERASKIPGLVLSTKPLEADSFNEHFFDAITLWHVFEHLPNPRQTLDIIFSILKPGGYLFLSLPNIQSWQAKLFKGRWLHLDPPKHLFFQSPKNLTNYVESLGFSRVRKTTFSLEQNPFGIQQSLLNIFYNKRELLFESLKGNHSYLVGYSRLNIRLQKIFYILTYPLFTLLALIESAFGAGGTMELVFQKTVEDPIDKS